MRQDPMINLEVQNIQKKMEKNFAPTLKREIF